ncbi:unnamed protein product [Cylicocyclus nassatus]|uniref:Uncharacterized protein n=1 Tax=Cylicocyclus nassatus TaxID=53992 RepID=A0AA36DMB0_CYLNA|nr:unnamed protein product [Cylicocyclus nassatus]
MHSALTGTELNRTHGTSSRTKAKLWLTGRNAIVAKTLSRGLHLSLTDGRQSRKATIVVGTRDIGESLLNDDYFSNMNSRAMRRIVSALTLTGKLMRAFEIEFS